MIIPEYYPPPRTEAWLTLPPGVVPKRDLIDSGDMEEPYEREPPWLGPTPAENRATTRRFIEEFGEEAAYQWNFPGVPSAFGRVMRDTFVGAIRDQLHDANRPLFGNSNSFTIPLKAAGGSQ